VNKELRETASRGGEDIAAPELANGDAASNPAEPMVGGEQGAKSTPQRTRSESLTRRIGSWMSRGSEVCGQQPLSALPGIARHPCRCNSFPLAITVPGRLCRVADCHSLRALLGVGGFVGS
jgi:hypothetical protein